MLSRPATSVLPLLDVSAKSARTLRHRSLVNLSKMGHCAPTVMQTLLDASDTEADWLVTLTAGLPGGIGNTGGECGGITAPLVLLGLRHAQDPLCRGVPVVISKGHDFLHRFTACHGTTQCRVIRGNDRLPVRCVGVIRRAPEQYAETLSRETGDVVTGESARAYARLHEHLVAKRFHCAHAVLEQLRETIPVTQEVLDGTSGFVGGRSFPA